jgi:hypothetical protein
VYCVFNRKKQNVEIWMWKRDLNCLAFFSESVVFIPLIKVTIWNCMKSALELLYSPKKTETSFFREKLESEQNDFDLTFTFLLKQLCRVLFQ